ncbi:MAG: hypothetical protein ACPGRZ_11020 [Alphaproteobacteria bacterium]
MAGFAAVGAALSGSRRDPLFDVFTGFGAVTGTMTVLGALTDIPFSWMAVGFWVSVPAAAVWIWRRDMPLNDQKSRLGLLARILLLSLPILLPVSAMQASQWDEFSQWLFNALYIYKFDAFPQIGLPDSPSVSPAYPHGNQLFAYLVSHASGTFVEMSVAFGNVLLLLALAPVYLAMVGFGAKIPPGQMKGWFAAALGILGVTVLSATFVQKLVFTAYADTSTAVLMGVLGVLFWRLLNDLAEDAGNSVTLAWQFALASALFINLKQANMVLLVILLVAGFAIVLRDPHIRVGKFVRYLPVMLALPLVVYFCWRFHVAENLTGREFSLLPRENWLDDQAFDILARMLSIASKKGAYFGMMLAISIAGLWCFLTGRGGRYGRLLFITGAVFLGYWIFLWAMYIAAFGVYEGTRAASFWRYNVQLGLLGALTAAIALGMLYERRILPRLAGRLRLRAGLCALVVLGVIITPLAANYKIRIDLRPQIEHMRMAGQDMAQIIPAGAALAVFDPKGQGFADMIVKYEVLGFSTSDPAPKFVYRISSAASSWKDIAPRLEEHDVSHVWVHQAVDWYAPGFGLRNLRKDGSTLVAKSDDGSWRIEKFWPYDGYTDPYSLPD